MRSCLAALLFALTISAPAATITVTGTGDAVAADGQCTLREAIIAANTNAAVNECPAGAAGLDKIAFNINSGGAQTINVISSLPPITDRVNISGSSQPGSTPTPSVAVVSSSTENAGLVVTETAGHSTIDALAIGGFDVGITVRSSYNLITRNFVGTNAAGTAAIPNIIGIDIGAPNATFTVTANMVQLNLISANVQSGIAISANGGDAGHNTVQYNIIGMNASKTAALPNDTGIELRNVSNIAIGRNTIAGNKGRGIAMFNVRETAVYDNSIGLPGFGNGSGGSATDGVCLDAMSTDNIIGASLVGQGGGNTIRDNAGPGVTVYGRDNGILTNSMSNNALAIDLYPAGPTANDACDTDTGANQLQNFPVLVTAVSDGAWIMVSGTLDSTPSSTFMLEFFQNDTAAGQGTMSFGHLTVMTDGHCTANFTARLMPHTPIGQYITATASSVFGYNTSEMSAAVEVTGALRVEKSFWPTSIRRNAESSTMRVFIDNPTALPETNVRFTDVLPSNLVIAATGGSTTCGNGILTAIPGSGSFSLSGATLPAVGSCTVDVDVRGSAAGTYTSTLAAGAVSGDTLQNLFSTWADLQVTELPAPTVSKRFTRSNMLPGDTTQLTITLTNASSTPITGVQFTDTYPAGLMNASAPSSTCGGTVIATSGGSTLTLSGGTIPASGSCTVTVTVQAPNAGSLVNTLPAGSVTSTNAAASAGAASAALDVSAAIPTTSEWGLLLIAIAMGMIAAMRLRG